MPAKSAAQERLMLAAAHTPGGYGGVPQSVGKEFIGKDAALQAAGTMFVAPSGTALWLKKPPKGDYLGEWVFPGGKIDEGETAEQAAAREAGEELNYIPEGEAVRFHRGVTDCGVDYTTMLQCVPGEFQVVLNKEHVAWAWAPLDDPPQPVHPGIVAMLAQAKQASDMVTGPNIGVPVTAKDSLALDRASIREIDKDGHLHVDLTNISKANVCPYYGADIPNCKELGLDPEKEYRLYRDPKELEKGAPTFAGKPLFYEHKPTSADDHQTELVVGAVMNPVWEAPYLKAQLVVWPGEAIGAIQDGSQQQLSCGYRYRADMTPGAADGESYDGVMRDIVGNHVALVEEGRAGPDVIVGDSKFEENRQMAKIVLTRKGAMVQGALIGYLAPKLAQDAKYDLTPILAKVTAKNFAASKPTILAAIKKAVTGKLAADANLEDMHKFMDRLDGEEPNEAIDGQDPETGHVEDEDPENNLRKFIKDRKMSKDAVQKACDEMDPEAEDEDETEEEKKAREAKDKKARDKAAKDKAAKDAAGEGEEKVDKKAMDAAIKAATKLAVDAANQTQREIRDAERDVRGHVGDLAIAHDSAAAVYRTALTTLGEDADEIADLPLAALKAILKRVPLPGSNRPARQAADSAANAEAEFKKMFPDAKPLVRT